MNSNDKKVIMSMIIAIEAQLDAIKGVLVETSSEPEPEQMECTHADMVTIQTMSGVQGGFCNECGAEFVVGVLDKDENNN